MKRINILDENTSNKIAAGEVVERPSSVVKELVENSIDAGSKNITIEIEDGGISLIRIIDDGYGIHKDDIKKAFMLHATSKIEVVEDIYSIKTLGFRGEALSSIASVSKVLLKSKTEDDDFGQEVYIESGQIISSNEVGLNKGTVIEVRDLFYNIPARRKFLKTASREWTFINDIVTKIALSNPSITIKLYNNGKKVLHTFGTGNLKDIIRTVYGKNTSENLIYFKSNEDSISLYGYIGKEEIARGSRNNQSIFVNGRYIKDKTIVAAVERAFKSFATVNKFPFFILFLDVYPEFIDVNIHPTKSEIKFKDERAIFKKVFDSVHSSFRAELLEEFNIPEEERRETIPLESIETIKFDLEIPKSESVSYDTKEIAVKKIANDAIKKEEELYKSLKTLASSGRLDKSIESETLNSNVIKEEAKPFKKDKDIEDKSKFPSLKVIGQFNKTYILAEYDEVLYIIDQHAAHEKILFEKYLKNIEEGDIIVQSILVPTLLDLNDDDFCYYEENKDVFKDAGFSIENFGGNTITIKEVPYFLGRLDAKNLFINILDNIKSLGSGKTTEVKHNKIATLACKAAVKANDSLSNIEMEKLINDLRYINDPFNCPHGRPIIIKFTNYELDKKFRRIV